LPVTALAGAAGRALSATVVVDDLAGDEAGLVADLPIQAAALF
jgi:hypothetical protein